jgi:hypothetical protein
LLVFLQLFPLLYRFAPLLTSAQLSLLSPESHIVPLTEVVGLGQKMLKVSLLHGSVADPDPPGIHMFLGLPDPDPLVRGMDPDPDPSIIMQK